MDHQRFYQLSSQQLQASLSNCQVSELAPARVRELAVEAVDYVFERHLAPLKQWYRVVPHDYEQLRAQVKRDPGLYISDYLSDVIDQLSDELVAA